MWSTDEQSRPFRPPFEWPRVSKADAMRFFRLPSSISTSARQTSTPNGWRSRVLLHVRHYLAIQTKSYTFNDSLISALFSGHSNSPNRRNVHLRSTGRFAGGRRNGHGRVHQCTRSARCKACGQGSRAVRPLRHHVESACFANAFDSATL